MTDDGPTERPTRRPTGPPSRRARNVVIGLLIAIIVSSWIGDLLLSVLVDRHPLLFIALNSRNRNLVLASPNLDAGSYYSVAFLRLVVSDPLFFLLGRWYGDAAVTWMERKAPSFGSMLRWVERHFGRAAYPLVALAPNNFICLFAGASGMGVTGFLVANVAGTMFRLYLVRTVGDVLSGPLDSVTDWIADHRLLVFAVSAALLGLTIWSERRAGGTEVTQLARLDEEIAEAEAEARAEAEAEGEAEAEPTEGAGD